ncbi:MAG: glycosyltransferase family 2 protein [Pseudomonadota bacterium]
MSIALCIPAYNAESHLADLLGDALAQTEPFAEIWVHDDASQDRTAELAESRGARVMRSANNVGCSLGKDRLLRRIRSPYVHFHDADDRLSPGFVAHARRWIRGDADVVLFGFNYVDSETGALLATRTFDDDALTADPVGYCISERINAICGLYATEAVLANGGYQMPPEQLFNEDQAFHCRLARAGLRFRADPTVLITNTRRAGSMSDTAARACIDAQYEVMAEAARLSPGYEDEVGQRLWRIAAVAASLNSWPTADKAAALAASISRRGPGQGHGAFRWLARHTPRLAVRLRERAIRWLGKREER